MNHRIPSPASPGRHVNGAPAELAIESEVGLAVNSSSADLDARRTVPFPEDVGLRFDKSIEQHAQLDWAPMVCGVMSA